MQQQSQQRAQLAVKTQRAIAQVLQSRALRRSPYRLSAQRLIQHLIEVAPIRQHLLNDLPGGKLDVMHQRKARAAFVCPLARLRESGGEREAGMCFINSGNSFIMTGSSPKSCRRI